jgi:hypothetical protein
MSFPKFPQLPRELQLMIWEAFDPEPQRISLYSTTKIEEKKEGEHYVSLSRILPPILYACHDSRVAGLKHYTLAFAAQFGVTCFFNFEKDILEIDHESLFPFLSKTPDFGISLKHLAQVKYLGVSVPKALDNPHLLGIVYVFFSRLQHLYINSYGTDWEL